MGRVDSSVPEPGSGLPRFYALDSCLLKNVKLLCYVEYLQPRFICGREVCTRFSASLAYKAGEDDSLPEHEVNSQKLYAVRRMRAAIDHVIFAETAKEKERAARWAAA